jgi:chorismate dehydratase
MGLLEQKGELIAGLYSLMDFIRDEQNLDLLNFCIATRDQVKSVMLFSKEGWRDLDGKRIGITDDTATSVRLLQVLLMKKYGVNAGFERMQTGINDCSSYDAVLLIGDEALRRNTYGLPGFELVFDLATEWYDWTKLPFVFAVWAVRKTEPEELKEALARSVEQSLVRCEGNFGEIGALHGRRIGLSRRNVEEYLEGFNFRLGEREKEAIKEFRKLVAEVSITA